MASQVDQVKERVDIIEIIGERVKLSRSGKNYRGLCPFHSEKSPSFFVSTDLQRYKCFGCQESGDVYTFLEKYDTMTFAEALEYLAKRAGIVLEDSYKTSEDTRRTRLLSLLSLSKEYYHYLLTSHEMGKTAREYLAKRGLHQDTISLFGIGYALPGWDGLHKYLLGKKGYSVEEIIAAGMGIQSERGTTYDRFRDRIMFPLTNARGQVVGFSGRVLNPDEKQAKYINTPETTLYHKSELLFGFSQLHRFISEKEEVLVMEGEFDVLSSFQAHVKHVVAIKGSALSTTQLQFLSRYVKRISFALDADQAGVEATKRAIALASGIDVSLRVIPIVGGKDPDEQARENPAQWRETVQKSVSVYEYLIEHSFSSHDSSTGEGKKEISKQVLPLLASIPNAIEQAHYVQRVAKRFGVSEDLVMAELRKVHNPVIAPDPGEHKPAKKPATREEMLVRYCVSLVFHLESGAIGAALTKLATQALLEEPYKGLVTRAQQVVPFTIPAFLAVLPPEKKGVFSELYLQFQDQLETVDVQAEFAKSIEELQRSQEKQRKLQAQLKAVSA